MAREHARAFADIAGVSVAGIHSRTRARAEALAAELGIPAVYDGIGELYDGTRADLVVVAVPELAMNAVAKSCFRFPWAVLLEKPAGYTLADAQDIAEAAEAVGARARVGLNRRFYASTQAMLSDLDGDPATRFIHIQDQQSLETARAYNHPDAVVANWMYANSIHAIDYLAMLGRGAVVDVAPMVRWDPSAPGVVLATVRFASGDIGLYEGIWNGPGPWACTVTTPRRRWELRPLEKAAYQDVGTRTLTPLPPDPLDGAFKPGFRRQAEAMAAVARGGAGSGLPSLAEALDTMRLIHDIYRTA